MFDLACSRERRREAQGFMTPAQAGAFLRAARDLPLEGGRPPESPITRAYFRAMEPADVAEIDSARDPAATSTPDPELAPERGVESVTAVFEILADAGVLDPSDAAAARGPRALLAAAERETADRSLISEHASSHPASEEELAYLANALLAGASIQRRRFTVREASECALATCNLGLENWPSSWRPRDLVTAFQVGRTILHRDVCMHAARGLIEILAGLRCRDRDTYLRLDGLRHGLMRHIGNGEPWHAGDALDVILILDAPAWAALRAAIDETPVIHAALTASRRARRSVGAAEFEFVSHNRQIAAVRDFLTELPALLTQ
jgi:hypothetical protein